MNIDTEVTPPEVEPEEDGDDKSARLFVGLLDTDNVHYDAAMQFFDDLTPDQFADALLRLSLAVANLLGPEHSWAAMQRFMAYDGGGA